VATGAVQRDANRTIIHADGIIQDVLKAVADNCAAYKNAADDRERLGVTMTTANAIRSISGTAPRTSFVEEALQVILRRRGRTTHLDQLSKPTLTVDGVTTTKSKALVLEQLLLCVGYDVANVYDYMPKAAPTPIAGEVSQDESSALAKRPNEFVSSNGLRTGRALL
jgi:hypothetical protein